MKILGIDPGLEQTALVVFDGERITYKDILPNDGLRVAYIASEYFCNAIACEHLACYGMAVGKTVFETAYWIGRFWEQATMNGYQWIRIYRMAVKMHLCGQAKAKDGNIRQALIDRFGAPGTKAEPGVLHGISKDMWSALAIAVLAHDTATNVQRETIRNGRGKIVYAHQPPFDALPLDQGDFEKE